MSVTRNVRRSLAMALAVVLALTMTSQAGANTVQPKRPNIIFFLVDDMSADLLPYMDTVSALATDGTRFTDYYVSNSLCCPSRASMFTGQFPHNTGVATNKGSDGGGYQAFQKHEGRTYAVPLDQAGYRTGYLGKYINEYPVATDYHVPAGWDEWHVAAGGGYNEFKYQLTRYIREQGQKPIDPGGGKYLVDELGQRAWTSSCGPANTRRESRSSCRSRRSRRMPASASSRATRSRASRPRAATGRRTSSRTGTAVGPTARAST
ncbi:Sulfatase [Nonomuraea solani]|uniref:Sulfatase n=1 Tax=Nonomuraea solani TaxID=1144553 RepID=A0A1H6D484_9ACTN|nr:Sulfatase [Nonomuraea solani]